MGSPLDLKKALTFILSSDGEHYTRFTILSLKTGTRFTYAVKRADAGPDKPAPQLWFVKYLFGPDNEADYQYIGIIRDDHRFFWTKKAKATKDAPVCKAIEWTTTALAAGRDLEGMIEIWHEDRCGRCGRTLTTPESCAQGYGPDCITKIAA